MEFRFFLDQIDSVAGEVLRVLPHPVTVVDGEMGAGKTTFIKAICRSLGIADATSSPTFSLVNEYSTHNGDRVYHFDLYRLKHESEALDMGIEEYLHSGYRCFIEWAEKIPNLLPVPHNVLCIEEQPDQSRIITVSQRLDLS